ncbi:MAG: S8 family serine peptidase [Ardenticatenaceae bacterium]
MYRIRILTVFVVLSALVLLMLPIASARSTSGMFEGFTSNGSAIGKDGNESGLAVYIVRLEDAPLASYRGGVAGLRATNPAASGANQLDVKSAEGVAYREYLANQQAEALTSMGRALARSVDPIYHYDVAFNGMALQLTAVEAATVANLSGVTSVQRDFMRQLMTDTTPDFIGATTIWSGTMGMAGTKGEGVIVGVIDTGIWPEHPSFADDGSYSVPPQSWGGSCSAPSDGTAAYSCTNKLIGVQHFLDGYVQGAGEYDGLFLSGRDDHGHGTHTSSTAAGNEGVMATLLGVERGQISGIAPRAQVSSYKGCGPQGCTGADLVAAINKAVADGVHVINYSIGGGSSDPWQDADAQAFLAARDAGVFVATSAGNSGPGAQTVGSPGDAPWVTTVGASTSNRHFISEITLIGPGTPPRGLYGASMTAGVSDFRLVDAEGIPDSAGNASGLCLHPFPAGTFEATDVVFCKRGQIARVLRGDYVKAGGAGGVILYNAEPQGLSTDNYIIPGVHVENNIGQQIKQYLTEYGEQRISVSFTAGSAVTDSDDRVTSDMMASFSSRGPNAAEVNLIKPDVTAPGVQILAGGSPQHTGGGAQGQLFLAIQGTSMSSPHVAGAAALIKALHPEWTPAEIQSALMSTANSNHVKEDGQTAADPFDMGAGRIDLTMVGRAGLVLNETKANYEAANPSAGGDPKSLNTPSMANSTCLTTCSWTRTVKSTSSSSQTWTSVPYTATEGLTVTVSPRSFTLQPGGTQEITVQADVTTLDNFDTWTFAQVQLTPTDEMVPAAHFPVAVKRILNTLPPAIEQQIDSETTSFTISDIQAALEITDLTIGKFGLSKATLTDKMLPGDRTNGNPFDNLTDGVFYITLTVPLSSTRLLAEITQSTAPDIDLYVTHDNNGDGMPQSDEIVGSGVSPSWIEQVNLSDPMTGTYHVLVQNWASTGTAGGDNITLATAVVSMDADNMQISGPSSVPAGQSFDLTVHLNLNGNRLAVGDRYYGSLDIGTDPANAGNLGSTTIDITHVVFPALNVTIASFEGQRAPFPLQPVALLSMMVLVGGLALWRRAR